MMQNNSDNILLHVKDICFNKGAITGISFDLRKGEVISVMGRSGCGKTSLLNILIGHRIKNFIQAIDYSGLISYNEQAVKSIAVITQDTVLFPWLNLIDNVILGLDNVQVPQHEKYKRASFILRKLDLGGFENAFPRVVSGGMLQRASIARALISDPSILFMDEPFSALDPIITHDIWEDLINLELSLIVVNHDIEQAALYSDKIILLRPDQESNIITVNINKPRDTLDETVNRLIDEIYTSISTLPTLQSSIFGPLELCDIEVGRVLGILGEIADLQEKRNYSDLLDLADYSRAESDDVIAATNMLQVLELVIIKDNGHVQISDLGLQLLEDDLKRPALLGELLEAHIPVITTIKQYINTKKCDGIYFSNLLRMLVRHYNMSIDQTAVLIHRLIEWCRYAELIGYDEYKQQIYILQHDHQDNS